MDSDKDEKASEEDKHRGVDSDKDEEASKEDKHRGVDSEKDEAAREEDKHRGVNSDKRRARKTSTSAWTRIRMKRRARKSGAMQDEAHVLTSRTEEEPHVLYVGLGQTTSRARRLRTSSTSSKELGAQGALEPGVVQRQLALGLATDGTCRRASRRYPTHRRRKPSPLHAAAAAPIMSAAVSRTTSRLPGGSARPDQTSKMSSMCRLYNQPPAPHVPQLLSGLSSRRRSLR